MSAQANQVLFSTWLESKVRVHAAAAAVFAGPSSALEAGTASDILCHNTDDYLIGPACPSSTVLMQSIPRQIYLERALDAPNQAKKKKKKKTTVVVNTRMAAQNVYHWLEFLRSPHHCEILQGLESSKVCFKITNLSCQKWNFSNCWS
jgi:hypothetical protein